MCKSTSKVIFFTKLKLKTYRQLLETCEVEWLMSSGWNFSLKQAYLVKERNKNDKIVQTFCWIVWYLTVLSFIWHQQINMQLRESVNFQQILNDPRMLKTNLTCTQCINPHKTSHKYTQRGYYEIGSWELKAKQEHNNKRYVKGWQLHAFSP